jgi:glutamate dehydrogenase
VRASSAVFESVSAKVVDCDPAIAGDVSPRVGGFRFALTSPIPLSLSALLPVFGHFGLEVLTEHPSREGDRYRYALQMRHPAWVGSPTQCRALEDAFAAVWAGRAESDGFNALILGAALTWRQVVVLRTIATYLRQTGSRFSLAYVVGAREQLRSRCRAGRTV